MPHAYTVTCLPHAYTHKLLKFKSIKLFWTNMKIFIILELLLFVAALCFTLLFGAYVPRYPLLPNSPLQNGVQQSARQGLGRETTSSGPYKEKERQREREKKKFWLKSTCRRPPREGGTRGRPAVGAESGLCFSGGWTFSRVGGGLSHYVAMFLLASAPGPSR